MGRRLLPCVIAAVVAMGLGSSAQPLARADAACETTVPNGSTPPGERPAPYFHGVGKLWTTLPPEGQLGDGFAFIDDDGSIRAKRPWFRGNPGRQRHEARRRGARARRTRLRRLRRDWLPAERHLFPHAWLLERHGCARRRAADIRRRGGRRTRYRAGTPGAPSPAAPHASRGARPLAPARSLVVHRSASSRGRKLERRPSSFLCPHVLPAQAPGGRVRRRSASGGPVRARTVVCASPGSVRRARMNPISRRCTYPRECNEGVNG